MVSEGGGRQDRKPAIISDYGSQERRISDFGFRMGKVRRKMISAAFLIMDEGWGQNFRL